MQNFFKLLLLLIMILQTNNSLAAERTLDFWRGRITGTWQGSMLMAPENEVTIQFIISKGEDSSYTVILNSPDHDAIKNVKANSVKYTSNPKDNIGVLKIDVAELKSSYEGVVKDHRIKGNWKQEGTSFPLNMAPQKDIYEADATAHTFFFLWKITNSVRLMRL